MATRLGLPVKVVRQRRAARCGRPGLPNVEMVLVPEGADAADDWIAERAERGRCLHHCRHPAGVPLPGQGRRARSFKGRPWTPDNIGGALAGRAVSAEMRERGMQTGGPAPLTQADRSRFLSALDAEIAGQSGTTRARRRGPG